MNQYNNINNNTGFTAAGFNPFAEGAPDLTVPAIESQHEVRAAVQMGNGAACAYSESISLRIQGALDVAALQMATQTAVNHPIAEVGRHKALPDIDDIGSQQVHIFPMTETGLYLVTIWQEVLKPEERGVQNNFFDPGGYLILTAFSLARIKQDYQQEIDALVMPESNVNASIDDVVREEPEF